MTYVYSIYIRPFGNGLDNSIPHYSYVKYPLHDGWGPAVSVACHCCMDNPWQWVSGPANKQTLVTNYQSDLHVGEEYQLTVGNLWAKGISGVANQQARISAVFIISNARRCCLWNIALYFWSVEIRSANDSPNVELAYPRRCMCIYCMEWGYERLYPDYSAISEALYAQIPLVPLYTATWINVLRSFVSECKAYY